MQYETNALDQIIGTALRDWQPVARPSAEIMQGSDCSLLPLTMAGDDIAAALFQANSQDSQGKMWTYLPYGPFAHFEQYQDWLNHFAKQNDPLFFVIRQQNQPLGLAAFMRIDPANGVIEIGHLAFSPALQRSTAATEAIFLMLEYAFSLGYRRVEWKCNALNEASKSAALRLGFQFDGIFRQAAVVKGRNRDTAWFAMLDGDWPRINLAFTHWLQNENFDAHGQQIKPLGALMNHDNRAIKNKNPV